MKLSLRRGKPQARRPRAHLMASFTVTSLVLTLALGGILAVEIQHSVKRRSVATLTRTARSAIAITVSAIVSGVSYGQKGVPPSGGQQQEQAAAISTASRVLTSNSEVVATVAVLADGTIIGGSNGPPVGTKVPLDADFRSALQDHAEVRTLVTHDPVATATERPLLARYGDLLVLQQGVRLVAGGPILAVVRSYAPLREARAQAGAETRSILWVLALGLLIFWLVLFRLVLGASRALRRQSQASVFVATHDSLTGLPNREVLRDRTEQAVRASRRTGTHVALILIDLDRFKEINDTFGHPMGDNLLRQIGPRLQEQLRDSDTVARIGGDEFVAMLPDLPTAAMAVVVAEKLVAALRRPFTLDLVSVDVDSSAGVTTTPEDGNDFDELLQHADIAMYLAKGDGVGVVAYAPELDSYSPARLSLLADLRGAVDPETVGDEIVLWYQPQADLATGRITGLEALVRWQHPTLGLLMPDEFIPLAEHTGIIRPLTWCTLRTALEQNRRWSESGLSIRVSVNISARCLLDAGFADHVAELLVQTGVPAARLELELTETAIMSDPERALTILRDLAAAGIRLSIDDFGTGYSSMAYLKNLPVHELKIDGSFVTMMDTDPSDAAIVRSSLDLARNLDLTVVAEGVETRAVWDELTRLGCPAAQGYFLARPLPAAEVGRWMAEHVTPMAAGVAGRLH